MVKLRLDEGDSAFFDWRNHKRKFPRGDILEALLKLQWRIRKATAGTHRFKLCREEKEIFEEYLQENSEQ